MERNKAGWRMRVGREEDTGDEREEVSLVTFIFLCLYVSYVVYTCSRTV